MQKPAVESQYESNIKHHLERIGAHRSVQRFISRYGKLTTKSAYLTRLDQYLRWLKKEKDVAMTPDELIRDNLICVFTSEPTDVQTKRTHTDLLLAFINDYLIRRGYPLNSRSAYANTIREFYRSNDSELWGDFRVAADEGAADPPKPLEAGDIRQVLKALPLNARTPLLCAWQSGAEINRVLGLRWSVVLAEHPLKLEFHGRKSHRMTYFTFLGRDSIEHLKAWKATWKELGAREPGQDDLIFIGKRARPVDPNWLNYLLKLTARRLHTQGLVKNGSPASWHAHALRHSFKTEAEHVGIKSAMVEFWMGHKGGISRVYDQRDEIHPEDFGKSYIQFEPYISLEYNEIHAKQEAEQMNRQMVEIIESLQKRLASLESERASSAAQGRPESQPGRT